MRDYYTYAYLRVDKTPYYIGKGKGRRIYDKSKYDVNPPKDKSRIIFLKQNLTEEEAFAHEIYMIYVFGRKNLGTGILRNKTNGGDGCSGLVHSEESRRKMSESRRRENLSLETRRKMSNARKGKPSPRQGKLHTEETKARIREAKKGENHHMYGKSHTEETKRKMSESQMGEKNHNYGKTASKETREKISKSQRGEAHYNYGNNLSEDHKKKLSEAKKGRKWWHDGCGNSKLSFESPGPNWVLGRK